MHFDTAAKLCCDLQDVENIVALPHEAAEAEDMLKDDTQLLQVSQQISHCGICMSGFA